MTNSNNTDLFDSFFRRADLDGDGQISGAEAVGFFQGSGLPTHVLAQAYDRGKNRFCCTSNRPATKDFRSVIVSGNGFASDSHFGDVFSATPAQSKQSSLSAAPSTSSIPVSSAIVPSSLLVGGQSTARPNQQVPPQSVPSAPSTGFPSGSSNAALSQSQPPWPRMTQSDIQKCTKVFVQVDTDRDGKLTGEQAHNLFLSCRLPGVC
ncbi:hypothetical protein NC651_018251 [Populus alba x Populus x berolinensis]|nr:hypothetical protein NC651_018251 [Populus alba x Populus x berolinensis]